MAQPCVAPAHAARGHACNTCGGCRLGLDGTRRQWQIMPREILHGGNPKQRQRHTEGDHVANTPTATQMDH
eukprot:2895909-Alexandrium_andersonii.AAC.1